MAHIEASPHQAASSGVIRSCVPLVWLRLLGPLHHDHPDRIDMHDVHVLTDVVQKAGDADKYQGLQNGLQDGDGSGQ